MVALQGVLLEAQHTLGCARQCPSEATCDTSEKKVTIEPNTVRLITVCYFAHVTDKGEQSGYD